MIIRVSHGFQFDGKERHLLEDGKWSVGRGRLTERITTYLPTIRNIQCQLIPIRNGLWSLQKALESRVSFNDAKRVQ